MPTDVTVQIVTYNSEREIGACLEAIRGQNHPISRVLVIDNGSTDGTAKAVAAFPEVEYRPQGKNLGYGAGHNVGFRDLKTQYALVLNPDVNLGRDYLAVLIEEMQKDPQAGMAGGRLVREAPEGRILDSAGLVMGRNRRARDRGQGEPDDGRYRMTEEVFGICGAAALFRREFLEDVVEGNQVFDEDLFMYKEDVDLSWRGNRRGWKAIYIGQVEVLHNRGWGARTAVLPEIRLHSLKNRYLVMLKNDSISGILSNVLWIGATEIGIWGYALLREPFLFGVWVRLIRLAPSAWRKRRAFFREGPRIGPSASQAVGREVVS